MSTFIHGGSALTLDIGAKAHAALSRGDVVAVNTLVASGSDGYETKAIGNGNTGDQQVEIYGVVLGSVGKSTFAIGEDILLRVVGVCDAALSATATIAPTQVGKINFAGPANNLVPTAVGTYSAPAGGNRTVATIQEARTGAGLAKVFINGMSSW
jgi:hypothetical protein